MNYNETISKSPLGWRLRKCGETIQPGDLQPSGPIWKPVDADRIGERVDGCCYRRDGSPDFIMGARKRQKPNRHNEGTETPPTENQKL